MTTEVNALLSDFAQLGEGEDLKSAAIGQNRVIPTHETVQAAKMLDHVESRPEKEVVGVAKDDLCVDGFEFLGTHCLDAALRSDGHENRRLNATVSGSQPAQACA